MVMGGGSFVSAEEAGEDEQSLLLSAVQNPCGYLIRVLGGEHAFTSWRSSRDVRRAE